MLTLSLGLAWSIRYLIDLRLEPHHGTSATVSLSSLLSIFGKCVCLIREKCSQEPLHRRAEQYYTLQNEANAS